MISKGPKLYTIPEDDLLNLTKDELIFKYIRSNVPVTGILNDEKFYRLRLISKGYNNPFMGLARYGGELYNRYICDFVLVNNMLSYNINIRVPAGVIDDRRSGDIKDSVILNEHQIVEIESNGFEKFIREYYDFMDIVDGKLKLPFSNPNNTET